MQLDRATKPTIDPHPVRSMDHLHPARRDDAFGFALSQLHEILERAGYPGSQGLPLEAGLPQGVSNGLQLLLNQGTTNKIRGQTPTDTVVGQQDVLQLSKQKVVVQPHRRNCTFVGRTSEGV